MQTCWGFRESASGQACVFGVVLGEKRSGGEVHQGDESETLAQLGVEAPGAQRHRSGLFKWECLAGFPKNFALRPHSFSIFQLEKSFLIFSRKTWQNCARETFPSLPACGQGLIDCLYHMSEFAYEHDIVRPPPRPQDPEEAHIAHVIEMMNQLGVYVFN